MAEPITEGERQTAPAIIVPAAWVDPVTGATYVHKDLTASVEPWDNEQHVGPIDITEAFGDVESWAAYVTRFGGAQADRTLLTWNRTGLRAWLDYHATDQTPNRCQWVAEHAFTRSAELNAWAKIADGRPLTQQALVEALEELAPDIQDPAAGPLMDLLRTLRSHVRSEANADLRLDGTTKVSYSREGTVSVSLPPEIRIAIPLVRGDLDDQGRPALYPVTVRLMVAIDEQTAKLGFRLLLVRLERLLDDAYLHLVQKAQALLGDGLDILRASDLRA